MGAFGSEVDKPRWGQDAPIRPGAMSLSSLIVQREVATIRQVEEALARQVLYGGDLEVAQLPEEHLVPLLAESLGMKHAMVGELPAPDEMSRTLVPEELATRRAVMPLKVEDDRLLLAVAEPLAADVIEELSFALGVRIDLCVAPMVRIRQAISTWYGIPLDRQGWGVVQPRAAVAAARAAG